jgi:hypothetical protein
MRRRLATTGMLTATTTTTGLNGCGGLAIC